MPITSHSKRIGISHLDAPLANQTDLAFNPIRNPRRHHTRPSAVMCRPIHCVPSVTVEARDSVVLFGLRGPRCGFLRRYRFAGR